MQSSVMKKFVDLKITLTKRTVTPRTFILMWNPAISSYTMERFNDDIEELADGWDLDDFDWSVRDWQRLQPGDRFYLVKVGDGNTGIVMSGVFTDEPYQGEDWSGKGREVYYAKMHIDVMLHPDRSPILRTEQLMAACPEFDWTKGSSGQLIDEALAKRVYDLWSQFLQDNSDVFRPRAVLNLSNE